MSKPHTPTPWELSDVDPLRIQDSGTGDEVATTRFATEKHAVERHANAARICLCVNAHDALVAALEKINTLAASMGTQTPAQRCALIADLARAALAAAAPEAARGHDDCCLSETDDCNWPECGCDEPQPVAADHPKDTHS
jgi:hypothetical protein